MGIVGLISGKRGKLYLRFIAAAALIIATVSAYFAFAAAPTAIPVIVNNNGTAASGVSEEVEV